MPPSAWDDNSEPALAGYDVYRHTASFSDTTTATRINGNQLVSASAYDVLGRRVAPLVDGPRPAGRQTVAFDAGRLASGLYLIRMQAGTFTATQRILLAR